MQRTLLFMRLLKLLFVAGHGPLFTALLLPLCGSLASCQAPSTSLIDPIEAISDHELSTKGRARAIHEAWAKTSQQGEVDRDQLLETTRSLLWRRSEPANVRIAALEVLADDNPDETLKTISLLLPTETHWPVIEWISDQAVQRQWTQLTPALVRSWSRPVIEPPDERRPERKALKLLHPGSPLPDIVFSVFATPASDDKLFGERTRQDAWSLLLRIDPGAERTRALLDRDDLDSSDPLIIDLRAAAHDLGAIPTTTRQLAWLRQMRQPEHGAFWQEAAAAIKQLDPKQREGLELRHAAVLRWAAQRHPELLSAARSELVSLLQTRLSAKVRHRRTADAPDLTVAPRETLEAALDKLVWADLLSVLAAVEAAHDDAIAGSLFAQAEQDLGDTSTEYGGVIDAGPDDHFSITLYAPRPAQRAGDNRFIASIDLVNASVESLFHDHFHAQRYANSEYAGPGSGDLEYAKEHGRACIVFTFIGQSTLDADYYQPNGARLDLGEIKRPSRPSTKR